MLKRPNGMWLFFCTAGLALALLPECVVGQISNITNTTVAPTPGSGHDYLGGVNDIVNPANGLPSVRIGLNTAAGRGLSVPLALSYNAGDVWILNSNSPDDVVIESAQKIASNQSSTSSPWTAGGWSITVPRLTQAAGSIDVPDPSNVTGYNPIKTCVVTTNFMFMDQAGGQHPLHMAYDSGNEGWPCDSLSVMTGGDDFVQSHIDSSYNVVDNQGTVYKFTLHKTPDFIEDRNGNRVLVTANDTTGAFDVTDPLNRKTVSVDGFGSGTNNVTVSGAGTYRLVWDTITVNLTFNSWNQGYDEFKRAPFRWELLQGGGTIQVIKEIDLPNNTKYQFQYDQYGLLTQISYPGGGWVKYTYTTNEQSDIFWLLMRTECCDPNIYPDDYWRYLPGAIRYSWPVVSTRSLSFNGVDVAMVQTFGKKYICNRARFSDWKYDQDSLPIQCVG